MTREIRLNVDKDIISIHFINKKDFIKIRNFYPNNYKSSGKNTNKLEWIEIDKIAFFKDNED